MPTLTPSLALCRSYIESQLRNAPAIRRRLVIQAPPFVTVSRQAGTMSMRMMAKLLAYFRENDAEAKCPWAVFNKDLVTRMLEDHHLPLRLAEFLPEDRISEIEAIVMELFSDHPPLTTLMQELTKTIVGLAHMGHVILVGRAAHIITASLEGGFHVRLIGSVERRVERLREAEGLARAEALHLLKKEDRARRRFVKNYFNADVEDVSRYHLVINTDLVSPKEGAAMIGGAVLARCKKA